MKVKVRQLKSEMTLAICIHHKSSIAIVVKYKFPILKRLSVCVDCSECFSFHLGDSLGSLSHHSYVAWWPWQQIQQSQRKSTYVFHFLDSRRYFSNSEQTSIKVPKA